MEENAIRLVYTMPSVVGAALSRMDKRPRSPCVSAPDAAELISRVLTPDEVVCYALDDLQSHASPNGDDSVVHYSIMTFCTRYASKLHDCAFSMWMMQGIQYSVFIAKDYVYLVDHDKHKVKKHKVTSDDIIVKMCV